MRAIRDGESVPLSVAHSVCLWESHLQTLPSVTQAHETTHPPQRIHDLLALYYNITASYFKTFVQLCPHQPLHTLAVRPLLFNSSLTGTCTCLYSYHLSNYMQYNYTPPCYTVDTLMSMLLACYSSSHRLLLLCWVYGVFFLVTAQILWVYEC